MNYNIQIAEALAKDGYTGIDQGEKRPLTLCKTFHKAGFKDARIVSRYRPQSDSISLALEGLNHARMGQRDLWVGPAFKDIVSDGYTEVFKVSGNQLNGYRLTSIRICKRLQWDKLQIEKYRAKISQDNFDTDSWSEYAIIERQKYLKKD